MSASNHDLAHGLALVALGAARAVSDYLVGAARTVASFDTKTDFHDPVTVHDRTAEAALHSLLARAVPGSVVLGEETGEHRLPLDAPPPLPAGFSAPTGSDWESACALVAEPAERVRWIVDPIDGTANFASGMPWFNTSIGVELDGEVVAGAITAPLLGEAFIADDESAWFEGPGGPHPLTADGPTTESEALLVSYYPGPRALRADPTAALNRQVRLLDAYQSTRALGAAALDLAYIAAGWIGAMIGTNFKPWDVAAGIHIIRVAGGTVTNLPMGTDLPDGLRPGVAAAGAHLDPATARAVLAEINSAGS